MQSTRPGLCRGARDEPGSRGSQQFPPSGSPLDSDSCLSWVSAMPRSGDVSPVPFCRCSRAQGQLLELAPGSRLRRCLPSCAGISAHPLGWGFQHGGSRSCWGDAPGAGASPQPAGTWGFLSSGIPHLQLPGEGSAWQGMTGDIPGWGEGAPLQPQEKLLGLRVVTTGLEEPPRRGEGTTCGRKYLAELKFLVEEPEFWAELGWDPGRNIGQRLCAGQGEELPSGCHLLCPLSQQGGRC